MLCNYKVYAWSCRRFWPVPLISYRIYCVKADNFGFSLFVKMACSFQTFPFWRASWISIIRKTVCTGSRISSSLLNRLTFLGLGNEVNAENGMIVIIHRILTVFGPKAFLWASIWAISCLWLVEKPFLKDNRLSSDCFSFWKSDSDNHFLRHVTKGSLFFFVNCYLSDCTSRQWRSFPLFEYPVL